MGKLKTPSAKRSLKRWHKFAGKLADVAAQGASPAALSELRRRETRDDPALFALVYLSKHLVDKATGAVTMSDAHAAWYESAKSWAVVSTKPMQDRRLEVAPRDMGKTTTWFLAAPLWAAAHGHVKFAAAFADSSPQAETHLATFKSELDNNALIRADYPDLVRPKTRGRGQVEADRVSLYHAKSGFVFAAAGADSRNLGLKVGDLRPDLLIVDDIEPHEGAYSAALAAKRLDTLRSAIFPLNIYAHVVIAGTVTMQGSIVHQALDSALGNPQDPNDDWRKDEHLTVRHTHAITTDNDGKRESVWPAKWSLAFLESIEHTRTYAKNYANDPRGAEGDYWQLSDFEYGKLLGVTRVLVSVDPAVTTKKTSDYTGIAVVGWSPSLGKCIVLEVRQVRKDGAALRLDVLDTIERHNAGLVYIEVNQGGDLWRQILWGLPVKIKTVHNSLPKEVRAADALNHYQRKRVLHVEGDKLRDYEGQLVAFPKAPHDDMVDAGTAGVRYFLSRDKTPKQKAGGSTQAY